METENTEATEDDESSGTDRRGNGGRGTLDPGSRDNRLDVVARELEIQLAAYKAEAEAELNGRCYRYLAGCARGLEIALQLLREQP